MFGYFILYITDMIFWNGFVKNERLKQSEITGCINFEISQLIIITKEGGGGKIRIKRTLNQNVIETVFSANVST